MKSNDDDDDDDSNNNNNNIIVTNYFAVLPLLVDFRRYFVHITYNNITRSLWQE